MSIAPSSWPSSTWSRGSKPSAAKSRGVPTSSSRTKSSSPPSGTPSSTMLWTWSISRADSLTADSRSSSACLDVRRRAPWRGRAARPSRRPGPSRPRGRAPSARRAACRTRRDERAAQVLGGDQAVDDGRRPRRGRAGTHGRGRGTHEGASGRSRTELYRDRPTRRGLAVRLGVPATWAATGGAACRGRGPRRCGRGRRGPRRPGRPRTSGSPGRCRSRAGAARRSSAPARRPRRRRRG